MRIELLESQMAEVCKLHDNFG